MMHICAIYDCSVWVNISGIAEIRVVIFWAVVGYIKVSALGQLTVPERGVVKVT